MKVTKTFVRHAFTLEEAALTGPPTQPKPLILTVILRIILCSRKVICSASCCGSMWLKTSETRTAAAEEAAGAGPVVAPAPQGGCGGPGGRPGGGDVGWRALSDGTRAQSPDGDADRSATTSSDAAAGSAPRKSRIAELRPGSESRCCGKWASQYLPTQTQRF